METLLKEIILREGQEIEFEEILGFKEFLIVFYGASWLPKSKQVASAINCYLDTNNPEDDSAAPKVELLYLSNDRTKEEFESFMQEMNENRTWCAVQWKDDKLLELKEKLGLDSLPRVLVFDKNLELVTENGAEDLLFLTPIACRSYWVEQLAFAKRKEQEEDDE